MYSVVTTRFNNETLKSNYSYRQKHNYSCMYCSPSELSPKIYYNTTDKKGRSTKPAQDIDCF